MDEFQVVKRRGRKQKLRHPSHLGVVEATSDKWAEFDKETVKRKLIEARDFIQATEFYHTVKDELVKVSKEVSHPHSDNFTMDVISYGLGNFADCVIARYQLAFLMAMREDIKVITSHAKVYDPKFWKVEQEVLKDLKFEVLDENEEGKRVCFDWTLLYMPHCGKALYNNLLWANWKPSNLSKMVIIGNSFSNIIQNTPSRLLQRSYKYIEKVSPYSSEYAFPETFQYDDVFNDTAVLWFPIHQLQRAPKEFWEDSLEPHYDPDDLEFIPNKSNKS